MEERLSKLRAHAEALTQSNQPVRKTFSYNDVYKLMHDLDIANISLKLQDDELQKQHLKIEFLQQHHTDLYHFVPFGYFTFNSKGVIIEINEAGANLIGLDKAQLIQRSLSRYITPNCQNIFIRHLQAVLIEEGEQCCELKLIRKNGPVFDAQMNSKMIESSVTQEKYVLSFITDITHRKQQEEYLYLQPNKIAPVDRQGSLEKFAAIVAHEINHPLSIISNYLYGCIRRLESKSFQIKDILYALKRSTEQLQQATEIILRMKKITCKGSLQYEKNDIETLLNEAIALVNCEINAHSVLFNLRVSKKIPALFLDKVHIQQAIVNVIRNAIEAMHDSNTLNPKIIIEVNQLSKSHIEILIIDNGPGIPTENIHQLFNSSFTTKTYGLGIGLAVSRSVIESHGGELIAVNNVTEGACFKITLPLECKIEKG